jgi:hypothetical protein
MVYICTKEAPWTPDKGTPVQHPDAKHVGTCHEGCCDRYECPHCGKIWQQENAQ